MQSRRVRRTRSTFLSINQHAAESPIKPVRRPLTKFAANRKAAARLRDDSSSVASPAKDGQRLGRTRSRSGIQAPVRETAKIGRELRSDANTATESDMEDSDGFIDESEGSDAGTGRGGDGGSAVGRRRNRSRPLKRRRLDASSTAASSPLKKGRARSKKVTRAKGVIDNGESPRKRKREDYEPSDEEYEEEEEDSESGEPGLEQDADVDDDDEAPHFIAEREPLRRRKATMMPFADLPFSGDQHLLHDASVTVLHRLKKSELVRLWKVAGLWEGPDEVDMDDEPQEGDMRKEELVNGIVAAVSSDISCRMQCKANEPVQRREMPADDSPLNRLSFISRQASRNRSTAQSSPNRSAPSSSEAGTDGEPSRIAARQNGAQRNKMRPLRSADRKAIIPSSASESNDTCQANNQARVRQTRTAGRKPRNVAFSRHSEESSVGGADDEDTGDQATDADSDSENKRSGAGTGAANTFRHTPARRAKRQALRAIKATDENQHDLDDVAGGPMSEASAGETVGDPTPRPKATATMARAKMPSQLDSPSRPQTQTQYRTRARTASFMETPDAEVEDPIADGLSSAEDGNVSSHSASDASTGSRQRRTRAARRGSLEMRLEDMDIEDGEANPGAQAQDGADVDMLETVEMDEEDEIESHFDDEGECYLTCICAYIALTPGAPKQTLTCELLPLPISTS